MSDDVIKNPNRKLGQPVVRSSKYIPEWQRLGKEPMIYETNPNDVMVLGGKKKTPMKTSNLKPSTQAPGQEHAPVLPPKTKRPETEIQPPQQAKVSIGQNGNWFDVEEDKQPPIAYDEIPDPPKSDFEVSDEESDEESEEDDKSDSTEMLKPGEYGILVKNTFVAKTSSLSEAEVILEKILFDELPAFSKVTMDDIMLIHRLTLKVGVLALSE